MKIFKTTYNLPLRFHSGSSTTTTYQHAFTLIEMLIVAPIVILVIGVFVSAIVSMTGDVLAVRGTNAMTYNVQNALNTIDADVKASGGYLATNNITLTTGQGYDNATSVFKNADATNGTMLILNSYATTANPLSSTRNFVYLTNQPSACSSASISQNSKLMTNIVYFVKNNALWRRVIMPSTYNAGTGINCATPWQKPTCAIGYSAAFCQANDIKMVDGISASGFIINYYAAGSTSANTTANASGQTDAARQAAMQTTNTIGVTINAAKTIAGRDITQSGVIKSVSANNNVSGVITTPITAIAAITGSTTVGSTLTAGALTPLGATVTYQWQSATTVDGTYTNISSATNSTYTLVAGDSGKFIKLVVTGAGVYSGTQTSGPTSVVATLYVKVLVVAGGGGGANTGSGGGGGGFLYNSSFSITPGPYAVAVGGGGGGGAGTGASGSKGNISSFSTIIAEGGGQGVSHGNCAGANGGSGGGGSISTTCTATGGAGSQGNTGGAGFMSAGLPDWNGTSGGGGGGATGSSGGQASGSSGNGGNGLANSISGTSITYAGGGGGGEVFFVTFAGTGGSGGGGNANYSQAGSAGTNGLGGGGGGGSFGDTYKDGGSGGSGIVIISYTTSLLTAIGGAITTSAGNTIHTFTTSGTFTVQ